MMEHVHVMLGSEDQIVVLSNKEIVQVCVTVKELVITIIHVLVSQALLGLHVLRVLMENLNQHVNII